MDIYPDMRRQGIYPLLFTDPEEIAVLVFLSPGEGKMRGPGDEVEFVSATRFPHG